MDINIVTTPASRIQDVWKSELLSRQETQSTEQYNPTYSFDLEFGNIPISHIPVINDTTPKVLIKKDKQLVLRSVAKFSAPSLFYYTLLSITDAVPSLTTTFEKKSLNIGLIGDEILSTQRFLQTLNVDGEVREYKINGDAGVGDGADDGVDNGVTDNKKFDIIIDSNHKSARFSKIITQNVLNTHNTRVVLSVLSQDSQLNSGGVFIARLAPKSEVSESLVALLGEYFSSVDLLYTFNGDLFVICIGFNANKSMPKFTYTYTPNTYIVQINGVQANNDIRGIINTTPSNFTTTPQTKKEIIADLKEKIDNSIEFLTKHNIEISIYYQPDQILSELQYFLDRE